VSAAVLEPVMPATLPLPALFHVRPVFMVTEDEDDRLSNIYWLSTPMGDESDHEQDLVTIAVMQFSTAAAAVIFQAASHTHTHV